MRSRLIFTIALLSLLWGISHSWAERSTKPFVGILVGGAIVNIGAEVVVVNTTFIDNHSVGGAGAPVS